ncbi:cation diffusion facilitator family transporter [Luteipulveratus sp. YIM 133132]|uniref:Cation diffusion facilitator family transporter n=1 Tax=Luteipulveratus flavus TaxID=3031728 RepID=A0ABT6CAR8_9MICO|nr:MULTISPECIES: cation diffusion facilitator family transporter [unclassified Luteipulveratus]MDE9364840.1 cation diffusion facilitator family transporter [Luteipulveratus sp. YIM 133132]MDF8265985.1 cation diffusion facilitator family transporter [Luteipulveratus sp. YIM 133296]
MSSVASGKQGDRPEREGGESIITVIIAFVANLLIAVAKTGAAIITGSASMVAEAAHSWADAGNEVFLIIAERKSDRPSDERRPLGYGKEAYVWSLFAAVGLLTAGAGVSIVHGIQELGAESEPENYTINYIVLGIAFVLEGISFLQALRQTRGRARAVGLHPLTFISRTSNPTLRAVFLEDSAALLGLLLAGGGVALHQVTGNAFWDALGSILVGVMLALVAIFLVDRNRAFLVGEAIGGPIRNRVLQAVLDHPEVERVTYLHLEFVGPERLFVVASVDLTGDSVESDLAVRLEQVEEAIRGHDLIETAVLSLSLPHEESLVPSTS